MEEERNGSVEERLGVDGRRPGVESGQAAVVGLHAGYQVSWSHSVPRI